MTIKDFYKFCCHTGVENKAIKIVVNIGDICAEHYLSIYDIYSDTDNAVIKFDANNNL